MRSICFITTCKGRLSMLRRTLPAVLSQPESTCLVVDYSCPEGTADWIDAHHPSVKVLRVPGQERFNLSHARNLGAAAAPSEADWLCFFDADILLADEFAQRVRLIALPGFYLRVFPRPPGTGGTVLIRRADFERAGGYDDTYQGWGDEDLDFYDTVRFFGLREATFPDQLLTHVPHPETDRTRFYDLKDRRVSAAINRAYRAVKFDLMTRTGKPLDQGRKQNLFHEIHSQVSEQALANPLAEFGFAVTIDGELLGQSRPIKLQYRVRMTDFPRSDSGGNDSEPLNQKSSHSA